MKDTKVLFVYILLGCLLTFGGHLYAQEENENDDRRFDEFVFVEGGSFRMGDARGFDSKPVHDVKIKDFYIGKYEVTVAQYRKFCEATGREMPDFYPPWGGWVEDHPMVNVSWHDAKAYAEWVGGRLPTEAEWEYASKGGKKSKGYTFSGSNDPDAVAWHNKNSDRTKPVGLKKPNELGIHDMSGNVWEWCSDWYDRKYYEKSPENSPQGPEIGRGKIRRGGSWFFVPARCGNTIRDHYTPTVKLYGMGLRVVKTKLNDTDKLSGNNK